MFIKDLYRIDDTALITIIGTLVLNTISSEIIVVVQSLTFSASLYLFFQKMFHVMHLFFSWVPIMSSRTLFVPVVSHKDNRHLLMEESTHVI